MYSKQKLYNNMIVVAYSERFDMIFISLHYFYEVCSYCHQMEWNILLCHWIYFFTINWPLVCNFVFMMQTFNDIFNNWKCKTFCFFANNLPFSPNISGVDIICSICVDCYFVLEWTVKTNPTNAFHTCVDCIDISSGRCSRAFKSTYCYCCSNTHLYRFSSWS